MNSNTQQKNVYWANINTYPIKRLNIIDGAPVNKDFFNNMDFLGLLNFDKLEFMFEKDEWKSLKWYWDHRHIVLDKKLFMFKVLIKHQLRKGYANSFHYETWIFMLTTTKDKIYYLCPLKRDSDFPYDIFPVLSNLCKIDAKFPWQRHSCQ
jgi:hypothetical protein